MAVTCNAEETRAIALVGMSLGYALAGVLRRKGVLHSQSMQDAFDAALVGLESSFASDDASAASARRLLDLMGAQLATLEPEHDQPRQAPGWDDEPRIRSASVSAAR